MRSLDIQAPPGASRRPEIGVPLAHPIALVATLCSNVLALGLPLVVLQVYDRIIPNASTSSLGLLVIGMVVVLVLDAFVKMFRAHAMAWRGTQFEHKVAYRSMERLMAADLHAVEARPPGQHLDSLASIEKIKEFYSSQASVALMDMPFVIIFLGLLTLIGGWLALVPLVMLLLAMAAAYLLGQRLRTAVSERSDWDERRFNFIIEILLGIHTLKAQAMEQLIDRRYERLMESAAVAGRRVALLSGLSQSLGNVFSQLTMATVVGIGSVLVVKGSLSIGGLAACTLLAGRTVQPVLRFMGLWSRFQVVREAREQVQAIEDLPIQPRGGRAMQPFQTLVLRKVRYRYKPETPVILDGIDLDLRQGEIIGITGGNGAGKTTLLNLIMGAIEADEGEVLLNGQPPRSYDVHSLSQQVSYLPQRPVLFNGTVLENITMFKVKELWQDAVALAGQLGLDDIFARMPDGYDTRVGDTAASIVPTGVAQRITIARALINRPSLILFDEANTSLDNSSDLMLRDVLATYRERAAMILVSFRPSLLRIADRRFQLTQNRLVPVSAPVAKPRAGATL